MVAAGQVLLNLMRRRRPSHFDGHRRHYLPPLLKTKSGWARVLLAGAIIASSLWDFRTNDVRLFDAISALLIVSSILLSLEPAGAWLARRSDYLFFFAILIAYAAMGYILHHHRSSLAIIVLSLIGLQLVCQQDWKWSAPLYKWLIVFHLTAFFIQFGAFYFFGITVDYLKLVGDSSRILTGYPIGRLHLRAAGVFAEPNSYALNMFVLGNLYILCRPGRTFVFVASLSMMLSESIWGIFGGLALIALNEMDLRRTAFSQIRAMTLMSLGVVTVFNVCLWIDKPFEEPQPPFYTRLASIMTDTSVRDRYLDRSLQNKDDTKIPCGDCVETKQSPANAMDNVSRETRVLFWIIGGWLTTKYFLEVLPANGFHFLFNSFGLFGLVLVSYALFVAVRRMMPTDKLFVFGSIIVALTTYPLITYVIFWIWLASLIALAGERSRHLEREIEG